MVIFLLFLRNIVPLEHGSVTTQSIPMDPEHSVIKGLHCTAEIYEMSKGFNE